MRPRLLFSSAALFAVAVATGVPACSNQGEGERCDVKDGNSGNDDCSGGLVCTPNASLNNAGSNQADVCCPQNRQAATTTICLLPQAQIDAGVPGDGGTAIDSGGGADAGPAADTGADAPAADSGADAADGAVITDSGAADAPADAAEGG